MGRPRSFEIPTWGLVVVVHAGWLLSCWAYRWIGPWSAIGGAWFLAWHNSLQHEAIHGHPTRSERLNALLVGLPLSLWLPFVLYRKSHRAHHRSEALADPDTDPESFYVPARCWARFGRCRRAFHWALQTLLGRLVLGPPYLVVRLVIDELRALRAGRGRPTAWLMHAVAAVPVLFWVCAVCGVPPWLYAVAFVYPGISLSLVRSFAEHRPAPEPGHRSVIVERAGALGWLFLFNNLHALHHEEPQLPWYRLPTRFRQRRAELLAANDDYRFTGYFEQLRRYAVRPKDSPVFPS